MQVNHIMECVSQNQADKSLDHSDSKGVFLELFKSVQDQKSGKNHRGRAAYKHCLPGKSDNSSGKKELPAEVFGMLFALTGPGTAAGRQFSSEGLEQGLDENLAEVIKRLFNLTDLNKTDHELALMIEELEKILEQPGENTTGLFSLYTLLEMISLEKSKTPIFIESLPGLIPGDLEGTFEEEFQNIKDFMSCLKAFIKAEGSPEPGEEYSRGKERTAAGESFQSAAAGNDFQFEEGALKGNTPQNVLFEEPPFLQHTQKVSGSMQRINDNKTLDDSMFFGSSGSSSLIDKETVLAEILKTAADREAGGKNTGVNEGSAGHHAVMDFGETFSSEMVKNHFSAVPGIRFEEDVLGQLIKELELVRLPGRTEMKVQLKPEHLGEVTILLAVEKGILKARLMAENQQVKAVLESGLDQIKSQLESRNFKAAEVSVAVNQEGSFYFQDNSGLGSFSHGRSGSIYLAHPEEIGLLSPEEDSNLPQGIVDYLA